MYICEDCGTVLAEEDLHTERSYVSDYMGGCYENVTGCPCGGSVEEADLCDICGEYFKHDDLLNGIWMDCLRVEMTVVFAI